LGNLFDRVVFGGVRDFLYFYLIDWPVFNLADSCLVVGALLLLMQAVFGKSKDEPAATAATAEASPPAPTPPAAGERGARTIMGWRGEARWPTRYIRTPEEEALH